MVTVQGPIKIIKGKPIPEKLREAVQPFIPLDLNQALNKKKKEGDK